MKLYPTILILMLSAIMTACNAPDKEPGTSTRELYFNYTITAEEKGEDVVCKFVFTLGRPSGKTLKIDSFGTVEFDDEKLQPDSSRLGGYYYEISKPLNGFSGQHSIVFKGRQGEELKETFEFMPFGLGEGLPATMDRKPLTLPLIQPPADGQELQLIMIDTSFSSKDVNETVVVQNGKIEITTAMLSNLVSGPIILELHQEDTRPLQEPTSAGGHITFFYSLNREFELKD